MPQIDGFKGPLKTAAKLVRRRVAPVQKVTIEDQQYDVYAEKSVRFGWITVFVQHTGDRPLTDKQIRRRYKLTGRQLQVMKMMADRLSNQEIAERLSISVSTTKRHAEQVIAKLKVRNRREIAAKLNGGV